MLPISELLDLINGRALYVRIPEFFCEDGCQLVSRKILANSSVQQAWNTTGLTHQQLLAVNGQDPADERQYAKGLSYYETRHDASAGWSKVRSEENARSYYALAQRAKSLTRQVFAPYPSPLDTFRSELAQAWAPGVSSMNLGEGEMFSGLLRILSDEVLAHEDKLERDHGALPEQLRYVSQFAVNTYLQTPEAGGELKLWDRSLDDEQYKQLCGPSYGIEHAKLGAPDACLAPAAGDLIVFNSRKLHGVGKSKGQKRISMASFMAYCGMDEPLYFWS